MFGHKGSKKKKAASGGSKSGKTKQSCKIDSCWAPKLEQGFCGTHLKEHLRRKGAKKTKTLGPTGGGGGGSSPKKKSSQKKVSRGTPKVQYKPKPEPKTTQPTPPAASGASATPSTRTKASLQAHKSRVGKPVRKAEVAGKGDSAKEKEDLVFTWVSAVLDERLRTDLQGALKTGVRLCKLANAIMPGCVLDIATSSRTYEQEQNINNYLRACRNPQYFGMTKKQCFMVDDLTNESPNMEQVVSNLLCLEARARAMGFDGPVLKVPEKQTKPSSKKQTKAPSVGGKFCPDCGVKQTGSSRFCPDCGADTT